MAGKWSDQRKRAHSARIKALRADPVGPYADAPRKLSEAHKAGKHPGFGERTCMTDEQRRKSARLAQIRYRARQAGKRITQDMYLARPCWPSVAEACKRLDAMLRRGFHANIEVATPSQDPTWSLWATAPVEYVPVLSDPRYVRDLSVDPPVGAPFPEWHSVHAAKHHAAELAKLVAEQAADAVRSPA